MDRRQQELRKLEGKISDVERQISIIERRINQADASSLNARSTADKQFWRDKEMALWKEMEALRHKEMMLGEERAAYMKGQMPIGNELMESIKRSLSKEELKHSLGDVVKESVKKSMDEANVQLKESMDEAIYVLSKGILIALKPLIAQLRRTPSVAQSGDMSRSDGFKKQLVSLYYDARGPVTEIYCNVTGLLLPSFEVIAGHIFPMRAQTLLNDFCPDLHNINDVENGILWASAIEQAFELSCMCFQWDVITHTLTVVVLDQNLMGKNLAEGVEYMRRLASSSDVDEEGHCSIEEESLRLSAEQVNTQMQEIMDRIKMMKLKNPKKEDKVRKQEYKRVFGPHINALYKSVLFKDLHMQQRQFPLHVNMSGRAFQVSSILAYQEAKRRGVLPADPFFNPYSGVYYDPVDVYLTKEASVSEICAELYANDVESEDSFLDS